MRVVQKTRTVLMLAASAGRRASVTLGNVFASPVPSQSAVQYAKKVSRYSVLS